MEKKTKDQPHAPETKLAFEWSRLRAYLPKFGRPARAPIREKFTDAVIGDEEKKIVRVIAFSAGGADNVFEFGMVHAFLVSDACRPHIVAGTSSGAVVAAMLADVLQAGEAHGESSPERRLAQVAHFRFLLEQIQKFPADFQEASFPDFTEVSARAGLKPLDLPTQQMDEKRARNSTALTRFGLTRLFNGMLSARVKFSEITRIVRLVLELQAVDEFRWNWGRRRLSEGVVTAIEASIRRGLQIWTGLRIWLLSMIPVIRDAPLLVRCVIAPAREQITAPERMRHALDFLGLQRLRSVKRILFESWGLELTRGMVFLLSFPLVTLAWVFAPPAFIMWLILNKLARRIRDGDWRTFWFWFGGVITFVATYWVLLTLCRAISEIVRCVSSVISNHSMHRIWSALLNGPLIKHEPQQMIILLLAWFAYGLYLAAVAMILLGAASNSGELAATFLEAFDIKKDLLTSPVLKKFLMRAFDPDYYGKKAFNYSLNEALGGEPGQTNRRARPLIDGPIDASAQSEPEGRRNLADWIWQKATPTGDRAPKNHPILVAPIAADVADGKLIPLDPTISTIDALAAACALTPLFAAEDLQLQNETARRWLVDGACVAREPIQPALDLIKRLHLNRLHPQSANSRSFAGLKLIDELRMVDLCVISPFPTRRLREQERKQMSKDMTTEEQPSGGASQEKPVNHWAQPGTLYRLADILALQATHSAKDERILVTLYNALLHKYQRETSEALFCSAPSGTSDDIRDWHVYANLREFEPKQPLHMLAHMSRCPDQTAKRTLLLRTIADGCRVSLTGLYKNKLATIAGDRQTEAELWFADHSSRTPEEIINGVTPPCRRLQEKLKAERNIVALPGILGETSPPGIAEVCKECDFYKDRVRIWKEMRAQTEHQRNQLPAAPDWGEITGLEKSVMALESVLPKIKPDDQWPRARPEGWAGVDSKSEPGKERPTVSLIFSGGVFRGVFQVGVLNAFSMAGIKPDLVAGASVGTIMAALAARVFTETDENRRQHRIAAVAATFLAIDRLVLTDRFADFVRRFTLRSGAADFSLRDADHLFRQFDRWSWNLLTRRSRRVLAGIHRLTYVDPLELFNLLSLNAPHMRQQLPDRLVLYAQDALNHAGVGTELLGAEPLEQLIRAHVLNPGEDAAAGFDNFLAPGGIHFMATSTNLTTGELDALGSFCNDLRRPALIPGLLASSAFPAVFRPRNNWELRAGTPGLPEELVDGGIADNLPIVPVFRFLVYAGAGSTKWLTLRPMVSPDDPASGPDPKPCPHLLLTASLEPRKRILEGPELKRTAGCWLSLRKRVGQMKYNVKVETHRQTQADFRKIQAALKKASISLNLDVTPELELPDLHISCVIPEWLCETFAFHPMLGFKRKKQAASIAHGCASTLAHLYYEQQDHQNEGWTNHWWNPLNQHPGAFSRNSASDGIKLKPYRANSEGDCWFVKGKKCPYSKFETRRAEAACRAAQATTAATPVEDARETFVPLGEGTIMALDEIYQQCGKIKTHERPKD